MEISKVLYFVTRRFRRNFRASMHLPSARNNICFAADMPWPKDSMVVPVLVYTASVAAQ